MIPGVSEGILRAEKESFKNFPSPQFFEKKGVETLKIAFLATFKKL